MGLNPEVLQEPAQWEGHPSRGSREGWMENKERCAIYGKDFQQENLIVLGFEHC